MCKSTVHNYLKKNLGLIAYKRKRQPLLTEKNNVKIDFDLQKNTKICLKKNGKTISLVTNHQCKIEQNDIVWEARKIKVPISKTVKKSSYVNIWGGGGGQCQLVDFQQSILCLGDKRSTRRILFKTYWRRKLSPC